MQPNDFTFAFLAKAVADAGGKVYVSAQDILRFNAGYEVLMTDDGVGGQILTLVERSGVKGIAAVLKAALDSEDQ